MSAFVDISDISIHATRTVVQESYAQLGDVLDGEQGVEGFFDYYDDWENDEADEFEYQVEVFGVITTSVHKRHIEEKQAVIDKHKKTIEELNQKIEKLENQIIDMNPTKKSPQKIKEGEE